MSLNILFHSFLTEWLEGATGEPVEYTHKGLCGNFADYVFERGYHRYEGYAFCMEIFSKMKLDTLSPFNDSEDDYTDECLDRRCHLNPKRIAWVRNRLGKGD